MLFSRSRRATPSRPCAPSRPRVEQLEERCLMAVDAVFQWNANAIEATKIDHGLNAPQLHFGPTGTSRVMAIESLAVFDAVNSITHTYTPYLTDVPAPRGASIEAAAAVAAYDTLTALYPYQKATFDRELFQSLAGLPLIPALEGAVVGSIAAHRMLDARAHDGSDATVDYVYGQLPGQWREDPIRPGVPPLGALWGQVTPFGVQSADQFLPPPPPPITSLEYAQAFEEVKAYGARFSTVRTPEQTDIGVFWGYDAQPGLCAPVRLYNQIAETLSTQMGNTEVQNARFFALVNMGMADAAITAWDAKYTYDLWRPVTAIRENDPGTGPTGLGSGNPYLVGQGDPNWEPFGAPAHDGTGINFTPPFPAYTSGHATIGGALFAMMADYYGTDNVTFTIHTDEYNTLPLDEYGNPVPLDPRTFTSFSQASEENGESRIYLGVHFNFDKVEGIRAGNAIADYIYAHYLLPRGGHDGGGAAATSDGTGFVVIGPAPGSNPVVAVGGPSGQVAAAATVQPVAPAVAPVFAVLPRVAEQAPATQSDSGVTTVDVFGTGVLPNASRDGLGLV